MKSIRILLFFAVVLYFLGGTACSPKYGCPSNGKNVGAERILSGEKVPKAKKFRS
ncbi:hypothetical protein [Longitalea arenae]|uniref:hypothetical protein n=1 Tax=Longitalea arenae TaxID=2812558 RepID=UPI001967CA80|nr:hypothetical protein [Longitalea arenae]